MVIFHSYVKLPEGIYIYILFHIHYYSIIYIWIYIIIQKHYINHLHYWTVSFWMTFWDVLGCVLDDIRYIYIYTHTIWYRCILCQFRMIFVFFSDYFQVGFCFEMILGCVTFFFFFCDDLLGWGWIYFYSGYLWR